MYFWHRHRCQTCGSWVRGKIKAKVGRFSFVQLNRVDDRGQKIWTPINIAEVRFDLSQTIFVCLKSLFQSLWWYSVYLSLLLIRQFNPLEKLLLQLVTAAARPPAAITRHSLWMEVTNYRNIFLDEFVEKKIPLHCALFFHVIVCPYVFMYVWYFSKFPEGLVLVLFHQRL